MSAFRFRKYAFTKTPAITVFLSALAVAGWTLLWLNPFASGQSLQLTTWMAAGVVAGLSLVVWRRSGGAPAGHVLALRQSITWSWLIAALLNSAIALCQYLGFADYLGALIIPTGPGDAYGNLRQRNHLATLTNMGLAALFLMRADRLTCAAIRHPAAKRVACVVALVLLVVANAVTASRIGLLQLLLVLAISVSWTSRPMTWRLTFTSATLAVYGIASFAFPWLVEFVAGVRAPSVFARMNQDSGCESRSVLWSNVVELIARKPWTGWGWGNLDYAHYATLYNGERFCDILDNAHNLPLHLAVELGVPVAVGVCGAVAWAVWRAAPWREVDPMRRLAWTVLALIGLHSMVEYPLWYAPFFTAAGLCVIYLWVPERTFDPTTQPRWLLVTRWVMALALTATVLHAWRDYHTVSQLYVPFEQRSTAMREQPAQELRKLVWFRDQADFAFLTTTPLTRANAESMAAMADRLLRYSPEPRVIEVLIESLMLQKREEEAMWHLARFRAAFPSAFEDWRARNGTPRKTDALGASTRPVAS